MLQDSVRVVMASKAVSGTIGPVVQQEPPKVGYVNLLMPVTVYFHSECLTIVSDFD